MSEHLHCRYGIMQREHSEGACAVMWSTLRLVPTKCTYVCTLS